MKPAINTHAKRHAKTLIAASCLAAAVGVSNVIADQQIFDDLIVGGSACIGFDCVNGESFGFDTIRLKENNLRIKFVDTSSSASFPTNDWQLTANDTSNGGANKFSIDDIDAGRTPFTIEAGAPSHSLYVDDGGRIGLGTSTPVADIHSKSGNTPTMRLEQDGSSGFSQQTWDVAGNETNFFIRDATNGSKLPFRIKSGADSNLLYLAENERVGINTETPDATLDVTDSVNASGASPSVVIQNTNAGTQAVLLEVNNAGAGYIKLTNSDSGLSWFIGNRLDGSLSIGSTALGGRMFKLDTDGNLFLNGTLTENAND